MSLALKYNIGISYIIILEKQGWYIRCVLSIHCTLESFEIPKNEERGSKLGKGGGTFSIKIF